MFKTIRHLGELAGLYSITWFFRILPFSLRVSLMGKFCSFLGRVSPNARERVTSNILNCFPEKSTDWHNQIINRHFYNTGRILAEYIQMPTMDEKFFNRWLIRKPSLRAHRMAFSAPVLIICGHIGHIEYMAAGCTSVNHRRLKIYTVAKRQYNPWVNKWLEKLRNSQQLYQIYTDESPHQLFRVLKEGHIVAIAADQDAGKKGPFYPFLGRLASTYEGPAIFARWTKVPIYFAWSYHNSQGQLIFDFQEIQRPQIDSSHIEEWDRAFTYTWVKLLEQKIHQQPADYYWLHKRWRHQPEDPQATWKFWHSWEEKNSYPLSISNESLKDK